MGLSPKYNELGLGRDMAWYALVPKSETGTSFVLLKVKVQTLTLSKGGRKETRGGRREKGEKGGRREKGPPTVHPPPPPGMRV